MGSHPRTDTVAGDSRCRVEQFCGHESRGFDSTNLLDSGDRHVTVGRGRDYTDVPPLRSAYCRPVRLGAVREDGDHLRKLTGPMGGTIMIKPGGEQRANT